MADSKKKVSKREIGKSGVQIYSGIISGEEYKRELAGSSGLATYDKMRRNDATVFVSLRVVKLPILGAEWAIVPVSEDETDKEVADFVSKNLFGILDWKATLSEILTHLDFGFSVHEMVFEPQMVDGTLRLVLSKLGYRKQTTIHQWQTEDGKPGVTQVTATDKFSIPMEKLVVFTCQKEGDNHEGISLLRSAHKHWYFKDKYYLIDAIGFERHSLGIIDIAYPTGASEVDRRALRTMAREARINESSFVEHPVGYEVKIMDMKAAGLKDPKDAIAHHDRQITKNVLAQFIELGATNSGSRAVSADHSRLFILAEQALADGIATAMSKAIKTLVDLNFTVAAYPTLDPGKLDDDNLSEMSEAVSKFVAAQAIDVRPEDQNFFRKMIGMAELTPEEIEDLVKAKEEAKQQRDDQADTAKTVEAEARRLHATLDRQLYGKDTRRAA